MNRVERLTGILLLLQDSPRTSSTIARHFEVSKRTVLRDVQALCELGIPIEARDGVNGGYALPPDYTLAPLPLTQREAFLLLLSLSAVNKLADAPFAAERASLLAKMQAVLPPHRLCEAETLLKTVSLSVPERDYTLPWLELLMQSAQDETWVSARYRSTERESTHHLLPRQLSSYNGFWYCEAYSHERQEERIFRVDRFLHVEPTESPLPAPLSLPLRDYHDPTHPEILVTLTPAGVMAVESEPHLGNSIERCPDGTGRLQFRCPPGELEWYAHYFLGLGLDVEVHAPGSLRQRLHELSKKISERYAER